MEMQLYCPDCGEKLTPAYYQSLVPEVNSYIHLNCIGRCVDDWCKANGLATQSIVAGIPKYTYDTTTINEHIAHRSDEGRSLPWLEKEFAESQDDMIKTIKTISAYLHQTGNSEYGQQPVEIENTLVDIMALNAAAGMDKSYVAGFLDALAMMK